MPWVLYVAGIVIAAGAHILADSAAGSGSAIIEIFLLYTLVIGVGISGIVGFVGHTFRAEKIAHHVGWPPGNPFQFEVAVANLALGVIGILSVWIRDDFWLATGIAASIFYLGAAAVHIRAIVADQNRAPGNAGPVLYYDLLLPCAIVGLLLGYELNPP